MDEDHTLGQRKIYYDTEHNTKVLPNLAGFKSHIGIDKYTLIQGLLTTTNKYPLI